MEVIIRKLPYVPISTYQPVSVQMCQGSFEADGHEVKVRPASMIMCFSPAAFNMYSSGSIEELSMFLFKDII